MSNIIKDLMTLALQRITEAETAAATAPPETTTPAPSVPQTLKAVAESAVVDVASVLGSTAINATIGSSNIVKLFTAVQGVIQVFEQVKSDIEANNPAMWGQITSAFPSMAKNTTVTNLTKPVA